MTSGPIEERPIVDERLFGLAVESSIHGFHVAKTFDQVLPPRQARLVRNLGCARFDCREEADTSLRAMGDRALRAAYWAAQSKDREIAVRGDAIMAAICRCEHCNATGLCPIRSVHAWNDCPACRPWGVSSRHDWDHREKCLPCNGTGDSRMSAKAIEVRPE